MNPFTTPERARLQGPFSSDQLNRFRLSSQADVRRLHVGLVDLKDAFDQLFQETQEGAASSITIHTATPPDQTQSVTMVVDRQGTPLLLRRLERTRQRIALEGGEA